MNHCMAAGQLDRPNGMTHGANNPLVVMNARMGWDSFSTPRL
jgi:hypothetical protein